MTLQITAILCVRNEERYLRTTLSHLIRNGIRLIVIDNESIDSTPQILDEFSGHMIERRQLKWPGHFDLTAVIERVRPVADQIKSGWILWQDADEILESHDPAESLRQAIERIDATGANVINFDEFVFLPVGADVARHEDFRNLIRHYYFHEPTTLRLMRAWRAGHGLVQADGGHHVVGEGLRVHSRNLVLRHYPFLSLEHARTKYVRRNFARRDIAKGWHARRMDLLPEDMEFPPVERLLTWSPGAPLDTSRPWSRHYWVERRDARCAGS